MKHRLNNIDFKTWSSWNMPYYVKTVRNLPDNNLEEHLDKVAKTKNTMFFVILGLCTVLIIIKWEQIVEFFHKNGKDIEVESLDKEDELELSK